jgi:hypothetical protein
MFMNLPLLIVAIILAIFFIFFGYITKDMFIGCLYVSSRGRIMSKISEFWHRNMETSTTTSYIISKCTQLTADALGYEMVIIKVGPEEKMFMVHKKLLCDRSDFFLKAISNGFEEGRTGIISFPEDTEEAFNKFLTWLYTGNIALPSFPTTGNLRRSFEQADVVNEHLIPAIVLGDKLCANEFMNKAMDSFADFYEVHHLIPSAVTTHNVFQQLGAQSKLCQNTAGKFSAFVTMTGHDRTKGHIQNYMDVCKDNPEFFQAVFEWQHKYGDKFRAGMNFHTLSKELGRCFFHVHAKGEICHLEKENSCVA